MGVRKNARDSTQQEERKLERDFAWHEYIAPDGNTYRTQNYYGDKPAYSKEFPNLSRISIPTGGKS